MLKRPTLSESDIDDRIAIEVNLNKFPNQTNIGH